jgi:hypothetical protein
MEKRSKRIVFGETLRAARKRREKTGTHMKKWAFICMHNSCRQPDREALGKLLAADVFES